MQNSWYGTMDNAERDSRDQMRMPFENVHHGDMSDDAVNKRRDVDSAFPTSPEHYAHQHMYQAPPEDLRNPTHQYNMFNNSAFEGATSGEENNKYDSYYGYLKNKRDSVLSCTWVPKNPKIFVRRIDGSKRPSKEMVYKLVNGKHNNEKGTVPFDSNTREAFVKQKMEEFEKMPCEYVGASTKNIISTEDGKSLLHNSNTDKESLKDFCVIDNHNPYSNSNVPLCVREMNQTIDRRRSVTEFPIQPLIQDEYYFKHVMSKSPTSTCTINLENILKLIKLLLRYFAKTIHLIFIKMKNELDATVVPIMPVGSNPLPNMDISCDVCERTDAQRVAQANQKKDFLSYFESIAAHSSLSKYLMRFFDDVDDNSKDQQLHLHIRGGKEPRAYYQEEEFPKDENGKVVLPRFE